MSEKLKRGTLKSFREYLNKKYPAALGKWRHNKFQQRTRDYGDYLFFQDRALFDVCLDDALTGKDHKDWTKP